MAASPLTLASHSGVDALAVGGLGIRAGAKQEVHHFFIGPEHRPMKRRGAIGLRCVHVGVLFHQRPDGSLVAAHDRVGNLGGSGGKAGGREQQDESTAGRFATRFATEDALHTIPYRFSRWPMLSPMLSW